MAEEGPGRDELETGAIVHPEPIRIPLGALEDAEGGPIAAAVPVKTGRWVEFGLPTLIVAGFAAAWTVAGWARHDVLAYAIGFAFTVAVIVSAWGRLTRSV